MHFSQLLQTRIAQSAQIIPATHAQTTLVVSAIVNIEREKVEIPRRESAFHEYVESAKNLLCADVAIALFCDPVYFDELMALRHGKPTVLIPLTHADVQQFDYFADITRLCHPERWEPSQLWYGATLFLYPDYVALIWIKLWLLKACSDAHFFGAETLFWIDGGICRHFFSDYGGERNPRLHFRNYSPAHLSRHRKLYASLYPGNGTGIRDGEITHIHLCPRQAFIDCCDGKAPKAVVRAMFFSATRAYLPLLFLAFDDFARRFLAADHLATEEALLTAVYLAYPFLWDVDYVPHASSPERLSNDNLLHYLERFFTRG